MGNRVAILLCVIIGASAAHAQDFGFGFDEDGETASGASSPTVSVKVGGEVAAEFIGYVNDFASLGDIFSGSLNFSAAGANADAFIGFNISAAAPITLDEAFLRAYFGPVNVEAGFRKLTWGRADSFGPLDVTNPLDYTDLTNISDIQAVKIARPMVHVSWNTGNFSKLEGVFIPNFSGHRFANDPKDRWTPSQFSTMTKLAADEIFNQFSPNLQAFPTIARPFMRDMMYSQFADGFSPEFPDTSALEYFQAGLRYTATTSSADIGVQYFYGSLFQPDVIFPGIDAFVGDLVSGNQSLLTELSGYSLLELLDLRDNPPDFYSGDPDLLYQIKYNRYHQIGVDYAQVLLGFNVRAEFAIFLTSDLKGDDGSVRNPFLGWSFGFDRGLFGGINANVQCNETIRLFSDKVDDNPLLDCEAGSNVTNTRITMQLSKKFLKDELETKAIVIWNVEDSNCYIIPAIVWNIKDVTAELSAGIFAGNINGEMGQYRDNSYIKIKLSYLF